MRNIMIVLAISLLLGGCATPSNFWKQVAGISTVGIEEARPDAQVKVFDYDYKTCYDKVCELIKKMPNVSVYVKQKDMIAIYVVNPNTTSVGIFFKEIDAGHTQVEISSESTPAKAWVAKTIFSETIQEQMRSEIKF